MLSEKEIQMYQTICDEAYVSVEVCPGEKIMSMRVAAIKSGYSNRQESEEAINKLINAGLLREVHEIGEEWLVVLQPRDIVRNEIHNG